jgi:hypothetical protein
MQVLEQLPEVLAIAVLAASPAGLRHHLAILPADLHALAIKAAIPDIRSHDFLALNFDSPAFRDSPAAYEVLHASITAASVLKGLHLVNIPVRNSERLLQLIPSACISALDVSLEYGGYPELHLPELQHIEQLGAALFHNTALTRLELTIRGNPCNPFNLDCLPDGLKGLQRLSLDLARHHCSYQ